MLLTVPRFRTRMSQRQSRYIILWNNYSTLWNSLARGHGSMCLRRVASWRMSAQEINSNNIMDTLRGGQPRITIGTRACSNRVHIWTLITSGRLIAHGCVTVPKGGCSLPCSPEPLRAFARRRTHPNFNSQHFSSFYSSAQR